MYQKSKFTKGPEEEQVQGEQARTGPRPAARFKPPDVYLQVQPISKLTKCPEQEQQLK